MVGDAAVKFTVEVPGVTATLEEFVQFPVTFNVLEPRFTAYVLVPTLTFPFTLIVPPAVPSNEAPPVWSDGPMLSHEHVIEESAAVLKIELLADMGTVPPDTMSVPHVTDPLKMNVEVMDIAEVLRRSIVDPRFKFVSVVVVL